MTESDDGRLTEILARYIDRLNSGEMLLREDVLREEPALAEKILEQLEIYQLAGTRSEPNQTIGTVGDYTLRRQIGRGGMGVVYEAWQNSMDRRVALKVLPQAIAADTRAVTRFIREAQIAGKLNHPHIVHVHGMGVEEQVPYYAMEFVDGETLAQVLTRTKDEKRDDRSALGATREEASFYLNLGKAFADVAGGLQHAHANRIIHRDIKPSNLILEKEGRLRILDFGLARLEGQDSLTITGDVMGTPLYMSPEQARRKKIPIDHRTDIYSLGATLYEILTLEPPFRGKDHADTLSQIIELEPVEPRRRNPRVPKDLETIVLKCLRKEPADRYGTAEALEQDLRRLVRGDPIEARPVAAWERLAKRLHHRRVGVFLTILTVLLLFTSAALLRQRWVETKRVNEAKTRASVMEIEFGLGWYRPGEALVSFDLYPDEIQRVKVALRDLDETSMVFPHLPEIRYYRAKGLLLLGRRGDARNELEELLKADPRFAPARALLSFLLRGEERSGEGTPPIGGPESVTGWASLWSEAYRAWSDQRYSDAVVAYGKLIELDRTGETYLGSSLETRLARGLARLEEKDFLGAIEDFTWVEALHPGAVVPVLLRGKTYCAAGKKHLAQGEFLRVIARPNPPEGFALTVAAFYLLSDNAGEALEWANRAPPGGFREISRAHSFNDLNRWDESEEAARAATILDPGSMQLHVEAGQIFESHTRYQEARKCYVRALEIAPACVPALVGLGAILMREGDHQGSIDACRKALAIDRTCASAQIVMGRALAGRGAFDEAEASCREAIRLEPKNALCHSHLGYVLSSQGKLEQALASNEKALQLQPLNPHMHVDQGSVLFRQGRPEEALQAIARAIELLPQVPDGNSWLASIIPQVRERALLSGVMDRIAERVEGSVSKAQDDFLLVWTLALARLYGGKARDPIQALSLIERILEYGHREDRRLLAFLEETLTLTEARVAFLQQLEGREPGPPSDEVGYLCVDALLERIEPAGAEDPELSSTLGAIAEGGSSNPCAYLRGRLLQRSIDTNGAADVFNALVQSDPESPVPMIRLVESLRAAKNPSRAADELRRAIERGKANDEIWGLWSAVALADLGRAPADVLAELSGLNAFDGVEPKGPGDRTDAISDLGWILERLQASEPIRIRCGGPEFRDRHGNVWSADRFGRSGVPAAIYWGEVGETSDQDLYRTARRFPDDGTAPAYRLPLPRGRWRITLHFAEVWFQVPGVRRFDVKIEGKEVLKDYSPPMKGSGMADRQTFQVLVNDGSCDIEFARHREDPVIAAIEVEAMD